MIDDEQREGLPFVDGPLPPSFRRRRITVDEGRPRAYDAAEWRDELVVVEHGRLHLECHNGGFRRFDEGAVVCLDGLALRALHNRGPGPTVLVAVSRRSVPRSPNVTGAGHPRLVDLPERPYLGVRRTCTRASTAVVADRIPVIVGHIVARGVAPTGAPFLRYHVIDAAGGMEVEAGVPVADGEIAAGEIAAGSLPAGRYAVARHVGHPDGLVEQTAALRAWAAERGLAWDVSVSEAGERWGCRVEHFLTHPLEQPDPNLWETELAIRLADGLTRRSPRG